MPTATATATGAQLRLRANKNCLVSFEMNSLSWPAFRRGGVVWCGGKAMQCNGAFNIPV